MNELSRILYGKQDTVHSVEPTATIHAAVEKMCRVHVGALLVCQDDALVGIVSERDVMQRAVLTGQDPKTTPVAAIMTSELVTISPETSPEEAMDLMTRFRCRHLPVIENQQIVGIVSIGDLVRWVRTAQEEEIETLRHYVWGEATHS